MPEPATRHLTLADGRNLSYSDTGTGGNGTWLHCHGIPGSRNELSHLSEVTKGACIRVVVPDRPGYGDSTPHPGFCFASHSDDLRQLADALGLSDFALSGFSAGGVFAMAAAHDLRNRISSLTIVATPAVPLMENPFEHASELTANAWQTALASVEVLALGLEDLASSTDALAGALLDAVGDGERQYLLSEPVYRCFHGSLHTALAQGPAPSALALARDTSLVSNPWPFRLNELDPPVQVLHGTADKLVYEAHQRALLNHLPSARSRLIAGVGHFDLLPSIWD